MQPFLSQIWRHPIKSLGAERVNKTVLEKGKTIPWDRRWALTYKNSRFDIQNPRWCPCQTFLRGSIAPLFSAVSAKLNEETGIITLRHPDLNDFTFDLEDESSHESFIKWVYPICPKNSPIPTSLCRVPDRGMTDTDYPSISLNSLSSLSDLSDHMDLELHPRRFRGNLWVADLKPWFEEQLIGKTLRVGDALLKVEENIVRCNTTKTNEKTGIRDADTLSVLQDKFGHKNFGIYCKVISSGQIKEGDLVSVEK